MKLHPSLTLEFDLKSKSSPFVIYVRDPNEKQFLGAYTFQNLQEAIKGFEIAWNVFSSACAFYDRVRGSDTTTIDEELVKVESLGPHSHDDNTPQHDDFDLYYRKKHHSSETSTRDKDG